MYLLTTTKISFTLKEIIVSIFFFFFFFWGGEGGGDYLHVGGGNVYRGNNTVHECHMHGVPGRGLSVGFQGRHVSITHKRTLVKTSDCLLVSANNCKLVTKLSKLLANW